MLKIEFICNTLEINDFTFKLKFINNFISSFVQSILKLLVSRKKYLFLFLFVNSESYSLCVQPFITKFIYLVSLFDFMNIFNEYKIWLKLQIMTQKLQNMKIFLPNSLPITFDYITSIRC